MSATLTAAPAPAAPAPPASRGRAPELQGYRGLAALSTVLFHVWQEYYTYDAAGSHPPVDSRWLGALVSLEVIDLFFVMSAYLLTLSYARAAIDGGSIRMGRTFLFRRAIRILPLYFLAVLVVWASRNPTLPGDWRDLVGHLTFTHVFDRERIFYTLGPTWSLSLEVAFYLALVALGPLAVAALAGLYALSYLSDAENFAHTFYHPIAALLWCTLLYATLHVWPREQPRWHGLLSARWVTAVGLISYSVYIWHEPVMLHRTRRRRLPWDGGGGVAAGTSGCPGDVRPASRGSGRYRRRRQ